MRRTGNLYAKIASVANLELADERARKGKKRSKGVALHDMRREADILALHGSLLDGTFRTSPYETFLIHDPKERVIHRLPYYPDRIVHHAVVNVLGGIWRAVFTADTYACIKGRGIHAAARAVKRAMKDTENARYCLKADIRKFYPSVDHGVLKGIVRKRIKCRRTLALLDGIIDSAEGLPIGSYLSQWLSNLYLAYFDHWVKEELKVRHYFRYADDLVFFGSDKGSLHGLLPAVREKLAELGLSLKGNEQVFPIGDSRQDRRCRGLDFVGYVFYRKQTLLRKGIKKRMCRKAACLRRKGISGVRLARELSSWTGWAKHCNARKLTRKIMEGKTDEKSILQQEAVGA